MIKQEPSQPRLLELFDYASGRLFWRKPPHKRSHLRAGDRAGTTDTSGYRRIRIKGKLFLEHRLIWIYHNGPIPDGLLIDHIDGDVSNNRIENLQPLSQRDNTVKGRLVTAKKSKLPVGVYLECRTRVPTYLAKVRHNGKRECLGTFHTPEEAFAARVKYLENIR